MDDAERPEHMSDVTGVPEHMSDARLAQAMQECRDDLRGVLVDLSADRKEATEWANEIVDAIERLTLERAAIAVLRLRDLARHNATVAAAMRHLDCDYVDAAELRALLMLAEALVASQAIAVELMSLDVRDIEIDGQRWANPTAQVLAREARRLVLKRWRTGGA